MAIKKSKKDTSIQDTAAKITQQHFLYVAAHIMLIVVFDSWNLITHETVARRWTLVGSILVLNAIVWYLARVELRNKHLYRSLTGSLILADIILAALYVYWERGMASISVGLFLIPIIMAATLKSRSIIILTAILSTAAYSISVVRYFNDNYGEGFRVQLYGTVAFFTLIFFIAARFLTVVAGLKSSDK